jgi:hypothetical protein
MFAKSQGLPSSAHGNLEEELTIQDLVEAVKDALTNKRSNSKYSEEVAVTDSTQTFLSETDLSKRWLISKKTLQRWRTLGQHVAYRKIGHRCIYLLADVIEYERQAKYTSTSEKT